VHLRQKVPFVLARFQVSAPPRLENPDLDPPGADPETTRSRPGTHPEPTRNLHGAHPEITRNSPGADPRPTRSLPGADPETIRSRPGAHQTVTLVTGNTYIYTKKHNVILCCKQYTDDKLKTPKVYFLIKEPQYRNLHPK
jgi:hypothetical protein